MKQLSKRVNLVTVVLAALAIASVFGKAKWGYGFHEGW